MTKPKFPMIWSKAKKATANILGYASAAVARVLGSSLNSNRVMAAMAVVAAIIAFWALLETRRTLVATNRAWIAPYKVEQVESLEVGKPILVDLLYKNVGQSPALRTNYRMRMNRIVTTKEANGSFAFNFPENQTCNELAGAVGTLTIYPGTEPPNRTAFPGGGRMLLDQGIVDRDAVVVWHGCFWYETHSQRRKAPFCFWLRPDVSEEKKFGWEACAAGDDAD